MSTKTKTIFFIADSCPTSQEKEAAEKLPGLVVFRNSRFIGSENPEACDFVAGLVPSQYEGFARHEIDETESDSEPKKRGRKKKEDEVE